MGGLCHELQSYTGLPWWRRIPENIGDAFNYSLAASAHLPSALKGSEVPGDLHYGISVVTASGTGRSIAVPNLLVSGVSDLEALISGV